MKTNQFDIADVEHSLPFLRAALRGRVSQSTENFIIDAVVKEISYIKMMEESETK